MQIRWLTDAVDDLQALRQYIAQDKPVAANNIAKRITATVNLLADQPALGRPGRVPHTRELIISGTPYIVAYHVKNNMIQILRVFHGAMQWPDSF